MPATVIAERIVWDRGLTILKERARELRPVPFEMANEVLVDFGAVQVPLQKLATRDVVWAGARCSRSAAS